jgi:hypothetical protein
MNEAIFWFGFFLIGIPVLIASIQYGRRKGG